MKNIGDLVLLHEEGRIELTVSDRVLDELSKPREDPDKATRARRALSGIRRLKLDHLYWPRPRLGEFRLGEVRLGDAGQIQDERFPTEDKDLAEFAIAGYVDFARQGRLDYFVTEDKPLLREKDAIIAVAPRLSVLPLRRFREELREQGFL